MNHSSDGPDRGGDSTGLLMWVARLSGLAVVALLMAMAFGEWGSGPGGLREWVYLIFFPFGFSVGYLLGWRWPRFGGAISLGCMVASLAVVGGTFDLRAYAIWGLLSVPAVLFLVAKARRVTSLPDGH